MKKFKSKQEAMKYAHHIFKTYGFDASVFRVKTPKGKITYEVIKPNGMTPIKNMQSTKNAATDNIQAKPKVK